MMDYHAIETGSNAIRAMTLVAKASGAPITSGTVNWYLLAMSGSNVGKWWRTSDGSWQATAQANAMTHKADGHWTIPPYYDDGLGTLTSPFADGVEFLEYAKESTDLHVPVSRALHAQYSPSANSARRVDVGLIKGVASQAQAGYLAPDWNTIANPTATVNLSGTTIATVTTAANMLTQGNVRSAVGMASANLDVQLAAISAYVDTEIAAILSAMSALPTAADNATAVASKSISAPQTPGTIADYLQDAAIVASKLETMIEAAGLLAYRFTSAALSQVSVDLSALGGASVEVLGPVLNVRNLRIVRNADYLVSNGIPVSLRFDGVADLSAQTIKLKITTFPERTGYWEVEATSADYSDNGLDLIFELPNTVTDLDAGTYYTQVDATAAGVVTVFGQGKLEVLPDVANPV